MRGYSIFNFVVLLVFAALLMVYLELGFTKREYLYILMGYGCYFVLHELVSFIMNYKGYFNQFWNYIDLTRIFLIYLYSIIKILRLNEIEEAKA